MVFPNESVDALQEQIQQPVGEGADADAGAGAKGATGDTCSSTRRSGEGGALANLSLEERRRMLHRQMTGSRKRCGERGGFGGSQRSFGERRSREEDDLSAKQRGKARFTRCYSPLLT